MATRKDGSCDQCEVLMIQGMRCHETGCPDAWMDDRRECQWCGERFTPTEQGERYCSDGCYSCDM